MQMNKLIAVSAAALMLSSVCVSCTSKKEKGSSSESAAEITTVKEETDPVGKERVDINDYITSGTPDPALWRAYDPETGNELYLMGTIHVVSEDTFPLPDYIMEVYDKCDGIAVEYDVNALQSDFSLMQEYLMGMVYTDGTTIKDHISEETYEKAKACLKDMGFYNSLLDSYMPGFWLSQIEASALLDIDNMTSEGVDSTFISYAENDGKEVVSIDTLQIQTQAVTGFSDELADYMLSETVDEYGSADELAEEFAQQYNSWASGDIDALAEDADEYELPDELLDDYADYMDVILYDRNRGMAEKAAEFLENGDNYFFMVGSMHFAGDRGVDDLLAEMGYTVERAA